MDCLSAGSTVPWSERLEASSGGQEEHRRRRWPVKQASFGKGRRRTGIFCCSNFSAEPAVFTAFRLNASALRIIGPGSNFITGGIGRLLAVDEFFVHPFYQQEVLGPDKAESLTYFLEEDCENDMSQSVKHGIQVQFRRCKKDVPCQCEESKASKILPLSFQVKDPGSVETLFLESGGDKGGAKVRVVAGQFESLLTSVQDNFVLLDIVMRPGSAAEIPVYPSYGLIIYILEGVGIFKRHPCPRPLYENEGHGIWFPQLDEEVVDSSLNVTCHTWSNLRFLVLQVT